MKCSELKKILQQNGCYKENEGRKHENWYSPKTGKIFQVGRHGSQDVKKGTLNRILTDAGIK
jgi:predicted RNA binding protein YcfA (HicA-like mRNA interferase family)